MRAFNAFQLTALFVAMPFLINWLYHAEFPFQGAASVTACIVYVAMFLAAVKACHDQLED